MRRGRHPGASLGQAWRNWYYSTLQFMARNRVFMGNTWFKVRNLEACCGNYGEPGC